MFVSRKGGFIGKNSALVGKNFRPGEALFTFASSNRLFIFILNIKKMKANVIISVIAMLIASSGAIAQSSCCLPYKKFGVELNAGASAATSRLAGAKLSPRVGGELLLHYNFMPHLGLYGGWGWNQLSAGKSFAGDNIDFEETGYIAGLEWKHPFSCSSPLSYYLRGGALYNHIEVENNPQGKIIGDTGHGWGYQVAGGLDIPVGRSFRLTPGVKFNSLRRDLRFEGQTYKLRYNYLSIRIGLLYEF